MASSQPGFMKLKSVSGGDSLGTTRRKRLNKNKKKNWNKNIDINDVDEFLEDIRHQERTTGGLLSEKTDESLFFLDVGPPKKAERKVAPVEVKMRRGKPVRPLRIDLILQHDSLVPAPKDVLSYQLPNAKKLRRIAQKAEHLAAKGIVPRRQKKLLNLRPAGKTESKAVTDANNNPERDFYDIWAPEIKSTADPWYLQQTRKSRVKRPEKLNAKPSALPAVEVIAPGGSYNPDFFSHQALLQEAHDVEVKKQKAEDKLVRQLAVNKDHLATEETIFREQVEGLVEQEDDHDDEEAGADDDGVIVGAIAQALKKTEKERRKERAEILKEQSRQADKEKTFRHQQLFQLRSIKTSIKQDEAGTKVKQIQRKANQEAEKSQPRRLGKLKFQAQDLEVQLSDELAGSLRQLKPEGSVLKDRFKSMQKRNLIEPRERAKFKRRLKVKYQEKRAFREIT